MTSSVQYRTADILRRLVGTSVARVASSQKAKDMDPCATNMLEPPIGQPPGCLDHPAAAAVTVPPDLNPQPSHLHLHLLQDKSARDLLIEAKGLLATYGEVAVMARCVAWSSYPLTTQDS